VEESRTVSDETLIRAVEYALDRAGFAAHPTLFSVHRDTMISDTEGNMHCHVIISSVHPITLKALRPSYQRLHEAARYAEMAFGLAPDHGAYVRDGDIVRRATPQDWELWKSQKLKRPHKTVRPKALAADCLPSETPQQSLSKVRPVRAIEPLAPEPSILAAQQERIEADLPHQQVTEAIKRNPTPTPPVAEPLGPNPAKATSTSLSEIGINPPAIRGMQDAEGPPRRAVEVQGAQHPLQVEREPSNAPPVASPLKLKRQTAIAKNFGMSTKLTANFAALALRAVAHQRELAAPRGELKSAPLIARTIESKRSTTTIADLAPVRGGGRSATPLSTAPVDPVRPVVAWRRKQTVAQNQPGPHVPLPMSEQAAQPVLKLPNTLVENVSSASTSRPVSSKVETTTAEPAPRAAAVLRKQVALQAPPGVDLKPPVAEDTGRSALRYPYITMADLTKVGGLRSIAASRSAASAETARPWIAPQCEQDAEKLEDATSPLYQPAPELADTDDVPFSL
jgi:hypothetical protein